LVAEAKASDHFLVPVAAVVDPELDNIGLVAAFSSSHVKSVVLFCGGEMGDVAGDTEAVDCVTGTVAVDKLSVTSLV
jgi:hypothetical protein